MYLSKGTQLSAELRTLGASLSAEDPKKLGRGFKVRSEEFDAIRKNWLTCYNEVVNPDGPSVGVPIGSAVTSTNPFPAATLLNGSGAAGTSSHGGPSNARGSGRRTRSDMESDMEEEQAVQLSLGRAPGKAKMPRPKSRELAGLM